MKKKKKKEELSSQGFERSLSLKRFNQMVTWQDLYTGDCNARMNS
jgi:hypothetical protein